MQGWIKWAALAAVGSGVGVYAAGLAIPQSHTATLTTTLPADPETVWAALTNVQDFPEWRPGVDEVEIVILDGRPGWKEVGSAGEATFAIAEVEPGSRMVTRLANGDPERVESRTWQLAPDGDGTAVRVTETGEIRSPVARFVVRFLRGYDADMQEYVRALSGRVTT